MKWIKDLNRDWIKAQDNIGTMPREIDPIMAVREIEALKYSLLKEVERLVKMYADFVQYELKYDEETGLTELTKKLQSLQTQTDDMVTDVSRHIQAYIKQGIVDYRDRFTAQKAQAAKIMTEEERQKIAKEFTDAFNADFNKQVRALQVYPGEKDGEYLIDYEYNGEKYKAPWPYHFGSLPVRGVD